MSRIGRMPVSVPTGVDVTINGREVVVKGPKGTLSMNVSAPIEVSHADGAITVTGWLNPRENSTPAPRAWTR